MKETVFKVFVSRLCGTDSVDDTLRSIVNRWIEEKEKEGYEVVNCESFALKDEEYGVRMIAHVWMRREKKDEA